MYENNVCHLIRRGGHWVPGAIVYDHLNSRQEAQDICNLLNAGVHPNWDKVGPALAKLRAERAARRKRRST